MHRLSLVPLVAMLAACSGESTPGGTEGPQSQTTELRELATVEIGRDASVSFSAADTGEGVFAVVVQERFQAPNSAPLAALRDSDASALELFMALTDREPPTELVELHAADARGAARKLELPAADETLKAYGTAACTTDVLTGFPEVNLIANNVNGAGTYNVAGFTPFVNRPAGNTSGLFQKGIGGVCADSAPASFRLYFETRTIGTGSWVATTGGLVPVAIGARVAYTFIPASGKEMRARVSGGGQDYHARTGRYSKFSPPIR